jgi:hypothetical protein
LNIVKITKILNDNNNKQNLIKKSVHIIMMLCIYITMTLCNPNKSKHPNQGSSFDSQTSVLKGKNISRINKEQLKLKTADACYADISDTTAIITGLTDDSTCPQKYVDLYKVLPAASKPTAQFNAYTEKCLATQCAKTACYEIIVKLGGASVFDAAFKSTYKANCIPSGAANILIDICTKGDDTAVTDNTDKDECYDSYLDLIDLLTPVDRRLNRKAHNRTLLAGEEAAALKVFTEKCPATICASTECVSSFVKATPTFDDSLKTLITAKCKPKEPESGSGDSGTIGTIASQKLLIVLLFFIQLHFWL